MTGTILSHYRIEAEIGRGGMGVVYRARDLHLDRLVALKVLPEALSQDEGRRNRLIVEAKAASALNHPNIMTVHDVDTDKGCTFIAMEYIDGSDLSSLLKDGPVEPSEAAEIGAQIVAGLDAAHRKGILHRDIKPANVMITAAGHVKITDFGLAKFTSDESLTQTSNPRGTSVYMSPEQTRGERLDERTDIWSTGVLLYELLTGVRPFDGAYAPALVYAILNEDPDPFPPDVSSACGEFERIVEACLRKNPDDRYASAEDLLKDLHSYSSSGTVAAVLHQASRGSVPIPWLAAGVAIVLGLVIWTIIRGTTGNPDPPEIHRLAVLRFLPIGENPVSQEFADGLLHTVSTRLMSADEVGSRLAVIPAVDVLAENISSVKQADSTFGVDLVITGAIEQSASVLRLTLNLIDAKSRTGINAETVDTGMADVLTFQDRIVERVVGLLGGPDASTSPASGITSSRPATAGTTVPGAYNTYLEGQGLLQAPYDISNVREAIGRFENALAADQGFALAHAGMGEALWRMYELTADTSFVSRAIREANRALSIRGDLGEVHATLGLIYRRRGRFEEAESSYRRALELQPNNAKAHMGLGKALHGQGEDDLALPHYRAAIDLRPDQGLNYLDLGLFYFDREEYEEALSHFLRTTELSPTNPWGYNNVAACYQRLGQIDEAVAYYSRAIDVEPVPFAYQNLASIHYFNRSDYTHAARVIERGLPLFENSLNAWSQLANSYYWAPGERARALPAWSRTIELARERLTVNASDNEARSILAESLIRLDSTDAALRELRLVLNAAPDDADYQYVAAKIFEHLGQRDSTLRYVQLAAQEPFARERMLQTPWFAEIRSSEGFRAAVRPGR